MLETDRRWMVELTIVRPSLWSTVKVRGTWIISMIVKWELLKTIDPAKRIWVLRVIHYVFCTYVFFADLVLFGIIEITKNIFLLFSTSIRRPVEREFRSRRQHIFLILGKWCPFGWEAVLQKDTTKLYGVYEQAVEHTYVDNERWRNVYKGSSTLRINGLTLVSTVLLWFPRIVRTYDYLRRVKWTTTVYGYLVVIQIWISECVIWKRTSSKRLTRRISL